MGALAVFGDSELCAAPDIEFVRVSAFCAPEMFIREVAEEAVDDPDEGEEEEFEAASLGALLLLMMMLLLLLLLLDGATVNVIVVELLVAEKVVVEVDEDESDASEEFIVAKVSGPQSRDTLKPKMEMMLV